MAGAAQRKVGARQNHFFAIDVKQPMADHVQAPVIEGQHFTAGTLLTELRATQQGLDPREQEARLHGFGQIIVRTEFEAENLVKVFVACREHQDDALVLFAHGPTDLEAVLAR